MKTAKDVIREVVEMGHQIVEFYLDDLTDADLLVRSMPESNHIAWQLGHLIGSTQKMLAGLGHETSLPPGFTDAYTKETAVSDDPAQFASKAEYQRLCREMKAATLAAIEKTPDNTLDQPGPEPMREYAPTVASVLTLLGTHWWMHSGQFVPIRRKLGRPPLF